MMYKIKEEAIAKIKKYGTVRKIAEATELTEGYISQVLNGKRTIKKKVYAYAITKVISKDLEIENIFDIM